MKSLIKMFPKRLLPQKQVRKIRKVLTIVAMVYLALVFLLSIFAPLVTKHNPLDLASINLADSNKPPAWLDGGSMTYILGTDTQGKDIFANLLYSMRISLSIAMLAVFFSMLIGVSLGILSGYFGKKLDVVIMRIVDIKLAIPAILLAMLVGGMMRSVFDVENIFISIAIIVIALAFAAWSIYTRAVRSMVMREKEMEYVKAARMMGLSHFRIILVHLLPNVAPMIGVLMIVDFATCITLESTLSFLGIGLSPTIPSLGTTIKIGTNYFLSGSWWIVTFPALALVGIIYAIYVVKDYMEDYVKYS